MNYREELREWLDALNRWKNRSSNKYLWVESEDDDSVSVKLYTDGHLYAIRATPSYLGAIASTRKPRPGEDWTRGNDLADGGFSRETWIRILEDILAYEILSISKNIDRKGQRIFKSENVDETVDETVTLTNASMNLTE